MRAFFIYFNMRVRNWDIFAFVAGYHVLLLALIPFVWGQLTWSLLLPFVVLFMIGGISITAGYHRLFAHRAYAAHPLYEWGVLLGSTLAFQWTALSWSHDHRLHHNHVDTEEDPYSINKGFWYAHMGWLFVHQQKFQNHLVSDLLANPRVMFQHRFYLPLAIFVNLVVFGIACLFFSPLAALWTLVLLRIFALHHCTWFINSLAHTIGSKTYAKELSAVDNALLAFVTFGEGYHNYHHAFAADYRNGIRWYHFDPTKWLIWLSAKLGLATNLRKINQVHLQKTLVRKDKKLLMERLHDEWDELAKEFRTKLEELSTRYEETSTLLTTKMRDLKDASAEKKKALQTEIRLLRQELQQYWRDWVRLTDLTLRHFHLEEHAH